MHTVLMEDRIHVAVDALIMTVREGRLELLLSRRVSEPCKDCWALPGRLVDREESAEEALNKLLAEMLPVEKAYCEQLYTFTAPGRDLRGRVISIAYLVIVPWEVLQPTLAGENVHFKCFDVSDEAFVLTDETGETPDLSQLAFDHADIVKTGIARLRGKIEYTDIGFRFLGHPEAFSLGELQQVFEAVLSKPQDTSNFRRFVLGRYESSGRIRQTQSIGKKGRGRPAALYCLTE